MNAKKCKAIRRELRELVVRATIMGKPLPPNGLMYKDTKKFKGFKFPRGWTAERLNRLVGTPWYIEARSQLTTIFARTAVNTPGSERAIYRATKKAFV